MILIADSGSTKTDWTLISPADRTTIHTEGINPVHQSEDDIRTILRTISPPPSDLSRIFFYGSGCTPVHIPVVQRLLAEAFPQTGIEVQSDLLGAARALCGHSPGIACILGTGANSCLYDGSQIVRNTPPMGYILGDEGSGAVLGRNLLNALYKGLLPAALLAAFEQETGFTLSDVIRRVYREPMPSRFLASLSPFISRHIDTPELSHLVVDSFRRFFRNNIMAYEASQLPVHFVGSIAWYYRSLLAEAAAAEGFRIGRISQSPMSGLIDYHTSFIQR